MLKRHRENLETRLEQVKTHGWAHITWNEIYLWYNAERIAVKTYKDVLATYRDVIDKDDAELLLTAIHGGFLLTKPAATSTLEAIIEHGYDNAPPVAY
ncbi:hypothetical protein [Pseudomonas syringae]|uniref:hypothetical protein n=1 Tax=Pseudomonas syringae TaxID=317 RepID=UPI0003A5A0DC